MKSYLLFILYPLNEKNLVVAGRLPELVDTAGGTVPFITRLMSPEMGNPY
jgi:hypothetical protein